MLVIPYRATGFPKATAAALHGAHALPVTWDDLIWAAITIGKPGAGYLFVHGWHSINDIIVRIHTIYAALRESGGQFRRSTLYDAQDPSEKGATSYFLGMAVAKLFAERLLNTPWLFHFSMTGPLGLPIRVRGAMEPDLLGWLPGGSWLVAEAKGRTNGFSQSALDQAKRQTKAVTAVSGTPPSVRVAVQAHFDPGLSARLHDPDPSERGNRKIDVDLAAAMQRYYAFANTVISAPRRSRAIAGRRYDFASVGGTGVALGMDAGTRASLEAGHFGALREEAIVDMHGTTKTEGVSTYSDGLAIELDSRWSSDRMTKQPTERLLGG
jgi:hypothetical protein